MGNVNVLFGSWETGGDQYQAAPMEKTISPSQGSGSRGPGVLRENSQKSPGGGHDGGVGVRGGKALRKGAEQVCR